MTGPDEQQDRSSLMPILTAVGVVVLVLIAFWISTFFRGDGPALSKIGAEADNKILDDPEFARDVERVRAILRTEWGA